MGLLLTALTGCGSANDSGQALSPPEVAPLGKITQVGPPPVAQQELEALAEENEAKLLELVPRALLLQTSNLIPFRATTNYGRPGTGFYFQYTDTDPSHYSNFAELYGPTVFLPGHILPWPAKEFTAEAVSPAVKASGYVSNGSRLELSLNSLFDPEITTSLQNLTNQDTFTLSGLEPPAGPNVTMLTNTSYVPGPETPPGNRTVLRNFSGRATLPSGRQAYFLRYFYIYETLLDYELSGNVLVILPPPPRMISIANMTSTPGVNTTLDFDISTTNSTLNRWSVEVQQNNTTIKSFSPTVDLRGPGTSSGFNPVHVSLPWDGRDGNNNRVVGNITWVASTNTTAFVTGGAVNDGIDGAQAKLDGEISSAIFEMKKLSASSITLVDVHNEVIKRPQYDADLQRKEPIALPIRDAFPSITADIKAIVPPDSEPLAYYIWGESPDGKKVFGPAQLNPVTGINRVTLNVHVDKITKYPSITWYYIPKEGGQLERIGTTDSPIYVTLDTPQEPQTQPRVDVVDFAVATQKTNNDTLNELRIASFLTTRIYKDSGFLYDEDGEPHHTRTEDPKTGRRMHLNVSNFLDYPGNANLEPEGNCQDFANLFQVCGAALGTRSLQVRRIDGPFRFRRVWPVGYTDWFPDGYHLVYHQTGWSSEVQSVFDPTYQLDNGGQPLLPINMQPQNYRLLLQERSQKPDRWTEQSPVRPLSVR